MSEIIKNQIVNFLTSNNEEEIHYKTVKEISNATKISPSQILNIVYNNEEFGKIIDEMAYDPIDGPIVFLISEEEKVRGHSDQLLTQELTLLMEKKHKDKYVKHFLLFQKKNLENILIQLIALTKETNKFKMNELQKKLEETRIEVENTIQDIKKRCSELE